MHRTNIYLSDEEHRALGARAAAEGRTRSEIIRELIDRELHLRPEDPWDDVLAQIAAEVAARARALHAEDPDLRSE